jgi:hypothetical protein
VCAGAVGRCPTQMCLRAVLEMLQLQVARAVLQWPASLVHGLGSSCGMTLQGQGTIVANILQVQGLGRRVCKPTQLRRARAMCVCVCARVCTCMHFKQLDSLCTCSVSRGRALSVAAAVPAMANRQHLSLWNAVVYVGTSLG